MNKERENPPVYLVWDAYSYDDGDQSDDYAYKVHATFGNKCPWQEVVRDAEHAAEIWAKQILEGEKFPSSMPCVVRAPDGTVTRCDPAAKEEA